jgi:acyl-coenzyme A synthetase/AMP-(fatty) acid ligase
MYHGNPLFGILGGLIQGTPVTVTSFSASTYWEQVRDHGATVLVLHFTPANILLNKATDYDAVNPARTAAILTSNLFVDFIDTFNLESGAVAYGSIETGLTNYYPVDKEDIESVPENILGPTRHSFRVEVVDETDEVLSPNEEGEIVVRPEEPQVLFEEYYNMPGKTLESFRNLWYHTGDIGYKDEQGNLYFIGRKKESIRVRGNFVPIKYVEETLNDFEGVEECAIIGIPSEIGEEVVKAFIKTDGTTKITPEDVKEFADKNLTSYMVPRYVEFIDEFPRADSMMKIDKQALREREVKIEDSQ